MVERLPAILALLTSVPVGYRSVASFVHRHHSPDWQFARGQWFVHSYDAMYTYLPILMLVLIAWGFRRSSRPIVAYGLGLLLVVLIGPLFVSLRVFPDHPVVSVWLSDPLFLAGSVLAATALLATGVSTRWPEDAAV